MICRSGLARELLFFNVSTDPAGACMCAGRRNRRSRASPLPPITSHILWRRRSARRAAGALQQGSGERHRSDTGFSQAECFLHGSSPALFFPPQGLAREHDAFRLAQQEAPSGGRAGQRHKRPAPSAEKRPWAFSERGVRPAFTKRSLVRSRTTPICDGRLGSRTDAGQPQNGATARRSRDQSKPSRTTIRGQGPLPQASPLPPPQ
jgi:hypothetical protein